MVVVLSRLLTAYRVDVPAGWSRPQPEAQVAVHPRGGMPLVVNRVPGPGMTDVLVAALLLAALAGRALAAARPPHAPRGGGTTRRRRSPSRWSCRRATRRPPSRRSSSRCRAERRRPRGRGGRRRLAGRDRRGGPRRRSDPAPRRRTARGLDRQGLGVPRRGAGGQPATCCSSSTPTRGWRRTRSTAADGARRARRAGVGPALPHRRAALRAAVVVLQCGRGPGQRRLPPAPRRAADGLRPVPADLAGGLRARGRPRRRPRRDPGRRAARGRLRASRPPGAVLRRGPACRCGATPAASDSWPPAGPRTSPPAHRPPPPVPPSARWRGSAPTTPSRSVRSSPSSAR